MSEAKLISASKQITGDYHGEMDPENYMKSIKNPLIPSLDEPSMIIIDNASCHSTLVRLTLHYINILHTICWRLSSQFSLVPS